MTTLTLRTGGMWDNMEKDQQYVEGNTFTVENELGESVLTIKLLPEGGVRIIGAMMHHIDDKPKSGVLSITPRGLSDIEVHTMPVVLGEN